MAEDNQAENAPEEILTDEAETLERLLQEEGAAIEEDQAGGRVPALLKNKFVLAGMAGFLLVLGLALFFLLRTPEEEPEELAPLQEQIKPEEEPVKVDRIVPSIYTLDPFFLPLKDKGKETGKFIQIQVNFQLSNQKLGLEVEKVLPLMRQTIYKILRRKRPQDFNNPKKPIDQRLKSEILTSANANLVSGTGKIDDVFFTEFMLR